MALLGRSRAGGIETGMIYAIAAMAENGIIGSRGVMPWHIPDEMKWFKEKTMGHTLVMGSTTYQHLPKPLTQRKVIVVTHRNLNLFEGDERCEDLFRLLEAYRNSEAKLMICGGASIYEQAMPYIDRLYLSIISGTFTGDTYFPKLDPAFKQVSIKPMNGFQIRTYER